MELQKSKRIASIEVVDTIMAMEVGSMKGAIRGLEMHTADIFLGLDTQKPRRTGLELTIQAAQLGRNGTIV